jgi:hypothetical protein
MMLDFAYLDRGLQGAEALRRHRVRTGKTGRGHDLWTNGDTETLLRLYPDYEAAQKALPGRTLAALKKHAYDKGIARGRHIWTAAEIARMRKLAAAGAQRKEIIAAFAPLSKNQIVGALAHYQIRRSRPPFKPTGHALLDAIRSRCLELRWSMMDLDAIAHTGNYFTRQQWYGKAAVNLEHAAKAIRALGDTFAITLEPAS